jgi:hypothetical protein
MGGCCSSSSAVNPGHNASVRPVAGSGSIIPASIVYGALLDSHRISSQLSARGLSLANGETLIYYHNLGAARPAGAPAKRAHQNDNEVTHHCILLTSNRLIVFVNGSLTMDIVRGALTRMVYTKASASALGLSTTNASLTLTLHNGISDSVPFIRHEAASFFARVLYQHLWCVAISHLRWNPTPFEPFSSQLHDALPRAAPLSQLVGELLSPSTNGRPGGVSSLDDRSSYYIVSRSAPHLVLDIQRAAATPGLLTLSNGTATAAAPATSTNNDYRLVLSERSGVSSQHWRVTENGRGMITSILDELVEGKRAERANAPLATILRWIRNQQLRVQGHTIVRANKSNNNNNQHHHTHGDQHRLTVTGAFSEDNKALTLGPLWLCCGESHCERHKLRPSTPVGMMLPQRLVAEPPLLIPSGINIVNGGITSLQSPPIRAIHEWRLMSEFDLFMDTLVQPALDELAKFRAALDNERLAIKGGASYDTNNSGANSTEKKRLNRSASRGSGSGVSPPGVTVEPLSGKPLETKSATPSILTTTPTATDVPLIRISDFLDDDDVGLSSVHGAENKRVSSTVMDGSITDTSSALSIDANGMWRCDTTLYQHIWTQSLPDQQQQQAAPSSLADVGSIARPPGLDRAFMVWTESGVAISPNGAVSPRANGPSTPNIEPFVLSIWRPSLPTEVPPSDCIPTTAPLSFGSSWVFFGDYAHIGHMRSRPSRSSVLAVNHPLLEKPRSYTLVMQIDHATDPLWVWRPEGNGPSSLRASGEEKEESSAMALGVVCTTTSSSPSLDLPVRLVPRRWILPSPRSDMIQLWTSPLVGTSRLDLPANSPSNNNDTNNNNNGNGNNGNALPTCPVYSVWRTPLSTMMVSATSHGSPCGPLPVMTLIPTAAAQRLAKKKMVEQLKTKGMKLLRECVIHLEVKVRGVDSTISGNYDHTSELIQAADGFFDQWHTLIGSQESSAPLAWRAFRSHVKELHQRLDICKIDMQRICFHELCGFPQQRTLTAGAAGIHGAHVIGSHDRPTGVSPIAATPSVVVPIGGSGVMSPSANVAAGAVISPASMFIQNPFASPPSAAPSLAPLPPSAAVGGTTVPSTSAPLSTSALLRIGALPSAPLLTPSSSISSLDRLLTKMVEIWDVVVFLPPLTFDDALKWEWPNGASAVKFDGKQSVSTVLCNVVIESYLRWRWEMQLSRSDSDGGNDMMMLGLTSPQRPTTDLHSPTAIGLAFDEKHPHGAFAPGGKAPAVSMTSPPPDLSSPPPSSVTGAPAKRPKPAAFDWHDDEDSDNDLLEADRKRSAAVRLGGDTKTPAIATGTGAPVQLAPVAGAKISAVPLTPLKPLGGTIITTAAARGMATPAPTTIHVAGAPGTTTATGVNVAPFLTPPRRNVSVPDQLATMQAIEAAKRAALVNATPGFGALGGGATSEWDREYQRHQVMNNLASVDYGVPLVELLPRMQDMARDMTTIVRKCDEPDIVTLLIEKYHERLMILIGKQVHTFHRFYLLSLFGYNPKHPIL